jgi:hypothetical protein
MLRSDLAALRVRKDVNEVGFEGLVEYLRG